MKLYRLQNNGIKVDISPIGASIVNFYVNDKSGKETNIVLGYDNEEQYRKNGTYFGAVVGPIANRVDMGRFTLDGVRYQLTQNDGTNSLHGGDAELNSKSWMVLDKTERGILLSTRVEEGEGGYPCDIVICVAYFLSDSGELQIRYTVTPQARCPINVTQHAYFNLDDSEDILEHTLRIDADTFLAVDEKLIPESTDDVTGTPFDFRTTKIIGSEIRNTHRQLEIAGGYDHCWCLNDSSLEHYTMEAYSAKSGIKLECKTDLPGVQFYSGNFLDNEKGRDGQIYKTNAGLCLETQNFPNQVNTNDAESGVYSTTKPFISTTVYKVSVA